MKIPVDFRKVPGLREFYESVGSDTRLVGMFLERAACLYMESPEYTKDPMSFVKLTASRKSGDLKPSPSAKAVQIVHDHEEQPQIEAPASVATGDGVAKSILSSVMGQVASQQGNPVSDADSRDEKKQGTGGMNIDEMWDKS